MSERGNLLLLVEDDPAVALVYRLGLQAEGYRVEVAPDGETGLRMARELRPDLVLLDIALPVLDGFEVLEALRALPETADLRVAVVSNSLLISDPRIDRAHEQGILAWLVKSHVQPVELARMVRQWLQKAS